MLNTSIEVLKKYIYDVHENNLLFCKLLELKIVQKGSNIFFGSFVSCNI